MKEEWVYNDEQLLLIGKWIDMINTKEWLMGDDELEKKTISTLKRLWNSMTYNKWDKEFLNHLREIYIRDFIKL